MKRKFVGQLECGFRCCTAFFLEPKKLCFDVGRWAQFIRKMSSLLLLKPLIANGKKKKKKNNAIINNKPLKSKLMKVS
jgi:hypothetical protein